MLEKIVNILNSNDELSGWQVREARKRSQQLFLVKETQESLRRMESLTYEVEVLLDHMGKGENSGKARFTGNSRFVLDASSAERFQDDLKRAIFAASLVENEPYRMPDPGPFYPTPALCDPRIKGLPAPELEALAGRLKDAVSRKPGIRLSSAEFFADFFSLRHFNSQGIQSAQESTLFSAEFTLLAGGPEGETEAFRNLRCRRVEDFNVEEEADQAAFLAGMRARAGLPKTGQADVVFCRSGLDHLFDWFTTQASAAAKYNRLTRNELGQSLVAAQEGATPLTLWHNAVLPWATGSYCFDATGVAARRLLLLDKGVLRRYWAGSRFAQYLKTAPSGDLGNLEVAPGPRPEAELLKPEGGRPLIQVFEFSYFEPNPVTGEFSGEIRSGLEITPQGTRPIKGGSVSGNSAKAFERAVFSRETCARESYLGPSMVRCEGLTIAGE